MSCSACKKIKAAATNRHGLRYRLNDGVTTVEGRNGKQYSLEGSLLPVPHTPRGGWDVTITLHGQDTVVYGTSPQRVFLKVKSFLAINEIPHTAREVWYNLNIQWTERAVAKYQTVTLDALLKIGTPNY